MNIELFGCSGGMAEGFRRAGITFDLVIDKDPKACDSYATNLGHRPIQMDVRDFVRMLELGWRAGPVQLLVADPPCTPWSTAGARKGLADERDCLRETVEVIRLLRPATFLIGNVPGLETAPNIHVVQETIGSLAAEGYCTADFAKLDAANYGVPQHRVRPFWFGHLEGPCLRWPAPTHGPPTETGHLFEEAALAPWVTCRDALSHLPSAEIGRPVRLRRRGGKGSSGKPRASAVDEPAHVVTTRPGQGDGSVIYNAKHPPSDFDRPSNVIPASRP
ncbi:MAG: DNA cytosine methyltransferase, partial [Myxococcota bacterium]